MILISHRGNTVGPNPKQENHPDYILDTLRQGYEVEIDVWYTDKLMLGHDSPQYEIDEYLFFVPWGKKLWIHCKNIEAVNYLHDHPYVYLNYFWHENDTLTLTSQNYIWAYPGKQPIKNSIAVMPELKKDSTELCLGICSDYISHYEN